MKKGTKLSDEHKKKIAASMVGKKSKLIGSKKTEEHKNRIAESKKGFITPEETKKKISASMSGKKFTAEHKEKISGKNNYRYEEDRSILNTKHTRVGDTLEHRIVMENHLGRKLTKEEVVHHINRNRSDNSIENLMLFPNQAEHIRHHNLLKSNKINNNESK